MPSPKDHKQARALLERLRRGELTRERLRIACYLGDQVAALALGEEPPHARDLDAWARGLRRLLPVGEALRAFAAITREALARDGGPQAAHAALAAAEACCADPASDRLARAAQRAAVALARAHRRVDSLGEGFYRYAASTNGIELAHYLALAASSPEAWLGYGPPDPDAEPPKETLWGPPDDLLRGALLLFARTHGEALTRACVRDALVPRALGAAG